MQPPLELRAWARPVLPLLLLGLLGCTRSDHPDDPAVLRLGVLPDQSEVELAQVYEPLAAYLSDVLGLDVEILVPPSYEDLIDEFERGRLDLALFGGFTFIQAESRCAAVPLVLRDVDLEFTSDFLVSTSARGEELDDFAGRTLAFGPSLSTSGHLMPRYHLLNGGIDPETFFSSVLHASGHDETASWVQEGRADVGVANSVVVEAMFRDGRLDRERVRLLSFTPPFRNYVWATPRGLDQDLRARLLDAFLALDRTVPEHQQVLGALGARAFMPASRSLYIELREAAQVLGLSAGEARR